MTQNETTTPEVSLTPTSADTDFCEIEFPTITVTPLAAAPAGVIIEQDRIGCAAPGTVVTHVHTVRNASTRSQIVNISTFSALSWDVDVFSADGRTRLTDTNDDGRLDVGRLRPGASVDVIVAVTIPPDARNGLHDVVLVLAQGTRTDSGPSTWVTNRTAAVGSGVD